MTVHRIHVLVELDVSQKEWEMSYGSTDTPERIADLVDESVNDSVSQLLERVGWGEMVRTTGTVVATTVEPLP